MNATCLLLPLPPTREAHLRSLVPGNWEEKTAIYSYDNEGRLAGASYLGPGR